MSENRSFREYISSRFDNQIFNYIAGYIDETGKEDFDRLELRTGRLHAVGDLELYDAKVLDVAAFDLSGMNVGFDIRVEAEIEIHEGDHHYDDEEMSKQWFVLGCTGDLDRHLDDFSINSIEIYSSKSRHEHMLRDSLVPIIRQDDYEKTAEDFLKRNYGKIPDDGYIDPMKLAGNMGLKVVVRSITKDCSVFGQIYFRDCSAVLYDREKETLETVIVKAGTVLVDKDTYFLYNLGKVNNTIIHECVHWDLHRKAFELDRLCNDDVSMIGCRVVGGVKNGESTDVSMMERQANILASMIQMPMSAFKAAASRRLKEARKETGKFDLIYNMQPVIDALAVDFNVSRLAAKIRMVEAGYEEAVGTFNYVDGHYLRPFSFSRGSLKRNQTFSIGAEDAARLAATDRKFGSMLSDGSYQYCESHFAINSEKYIRSDDNGQTFLTDYALTHMDECCLAFDMKITGCCEEYFTECYLNKDENARISVGIIYSGGLQNSSPEKQKGELSSKIMEEAQIYSKFTTDYVQCLRVVYEWRKTTYKEIAANTGMNADVVSRIINGVNPPRTETLALICLALKMPYNMSSYIFRQSPCNIQYSNEEHVWIDFTLRCMSGQSMETDREFLREHDVII